MIRNYNNPDVDMFSTGDTHCGHFITYKADFILLDPEFADPFADNWQASIAASEGYETAETRDDQLQQQTADVEGVMADARKCYTGMKYFIEKAFADKPKIRQKFGLDDYDDVAQSQKKMRSFLLNLHTQSIMPANMIMLTGAGCTPMRIAEIQTIQGTLRSEDREQNIFATAEPMATKGRIAQYNTTYEFDQKVNRASKVIFYNNPEALNLFLFPRHSEPAEVFNVLGTVRDAANSPISGVQVRIFVSASSPIAVTTSDTNGEYGFAAIAPGNYSLEFSKTGSTTQILSVTVLASGQVTVDVVMS